MPYVVLGVTGGIAAYKVADLAGALIKESTDSGPYQLRVIMTENAKKFITPLTLSTMSRSPIYDDSMEWAADGHIKHIELAKWCDIFVVVPATANTIAKMAQGIADNLLTSTYLALTGLEKVLICPAMNMHMWGTKQTQENLGILKSNKKVETRILQPEEGMLACGDFGVGKLPSVRRIVEEIKTFSV